METLVEEEQEARRLGPAGELLVVVSSVLLEPPQEHQLSDIVVLVRQQLTCNGSSNQHNKGSHESPIAVDGKVFFLLGKPHCPHLQPL